MRVNFNSSAVVVLGGDSRQAEVVRRFLSLGAEVRVCGLPWSEDFRRAKRPETVAEAFREARVVIGPVLGVDASGFVHAQPGVDRPEVREEDLRLLEPGACFFIGLATSALREMAARTGVTLVEYRDRDDFAILNSIPSAEGAIQMAMEMLPITLHGSSAFVLGFGRTGQTLAGMLRGIGARVTVAARKARDLARIFAEGHRPVEFGELVGELGEADAVFNTVPALVLDAKALSALNREAAVIDLASAPGGTDFEAARRLGIRAVLAPGLPGKVAPKTAGRYVADLVVRYLKENLKEDLKENFLSDAEV